MAESNEEKLMTWHLYEMMAKRGIRTATQLHRLLRDAGVNITSGHLSSLVSKTPRRVSSELMYGLTTVLDCSVDDIWRNPDRSEYMRGKVVAAPEPSSPRKVPKYDVDEEPPDEEVVGPKVGPFRMPDRDKSTG